MPSLVCCAKQTIARKIGLSSLPLMDTKPNRRSFKLEVARIRNEYSRRARDLPQGFYSVLQPSNLFAIEGRNRSFIQLLRSTGIRISSETKILEVGCGSGGWSPLFSEIGIPASNLAGIDLMEPRIRNAKSVFQGGCFCVGNAVYLPWKSGTFDVVVQSMVFTSILNEGMRKAVAAEMVRVLARKGFIVWYDFTYDSPRNPNVKGVPKSWVHKYFPGSHIFCKRITLAPPLARRIVPISWFLADLLQRLYLLNTHILCIIVPQYTDTRD